MIFLLLFGCHTEPECGEGWNEDQLVSGYAEAMCTQIEQCGGGDYGIYEGPDHVGCVANAAAYFREHKLADQQAEECGKFDSCAAELCVDDMWTFIETCDGESFGCSAVQVYDPGCPEPAVP